MHRGERQADFSRVARPVAEPLNYARLMAIQGGLTFWIYFAVSAGLLVGIVMFFVHQISHWSGGSYELAPLKDRVELHQINAAILVYADKHFGQYPDSLDDLLIEGLITPDTLIVPWDDKTKPARGDNLYAISADFKAGGHCAFIYTGKGLIEGADPEIVVCYEPLSLHGGQGTEVLFPDGHVEWETIPYAKALVDADAAGVRPLRIPYQQMPATQPGH